MPIHLIQRLFAPPPAPPQPARLSREELATLFAPDLAPG